MKHTVFRASICGLIALAFAGCSSPTRSTLPTPSNFNATVVSSTTAYLDWGVTSGAKKYVLERRQGTEPYTLLTDTVNTAFTDVSLHPGRDYTYRLSATQGSNRSGSIESSVLSTPEPVNPDGIGLLPNNPAPILVGDRLEFSASLNTDGAVNWSLVPDNGALSSNGLDAVFRPREAGQYTLQVSNASNSAQRASVQIQVDAPVVNPPVTGNDASRVGRWSPRFDWSKRSDGRLIVPIHLAVMPNGKVLTIGWSPLDQFEQTNDADLWDPSLGTGSNAHQLVRNNFANVFCSGHSLLPDGRLFVAGGKSNDETGIFTTSLFDVNQNQTGGWSRLSDLREARYYPSTLTLQNGNVLITGGSNQYTENSASSELWLYNSPSPVNSGARSVALPGASRNTIRYYPMIFQGRNGKVYEVGPEQNTYEIDTNGTGSRTWLRERDNLYRDYGSAVMYQPGKVVIIGGSNPPTASSVLIDINDNASVTPTGSMGQPRRQHNSTLLPDGTVLVTGGSSGEGFNNIFAPVYRAEIWNPETGNFVQLASMTTPRLYHSSAMLLPDGRVLVAGGGGAEGADQPNAEIFSPPYLFKKDGSGALAERPTIWYSQENIAYGSNFIVGTAVAPSASKVTMVRLSSVTHSTNFDQRFVNLGFSVNNATQLSVQAPNDRNSLMPGYYMLFVFDRNGVPSEAKIVHLG